MSVALTNEKGADGAIRTLGDLLYADRTRPRLSEEEWVALVRSIGQGDQSALHALYERTHRIVFTLAMRISGNRLTAEALTLDVFHDVWRRASTYDPQNGSVLGWLMNQARSRAIDRLHYERRKKRVASSSGDTAEQAAGAESATEAQDEHRMLTEGLSALSEAERAAIETTFFQALSYAETATRLNEPCGTIKSRIRSGLQKLRRTAAAKTRMP